MFMPENMSEASRVTSLIRFIKPSTYWNRARRAWFDWSYDFQKVRNEENDRFRAAGYDQHAALAELDQHLLDMELPVFEKCGDMASVHWLLFACLARRHRIARVLEIGTFDGQTTSLLARLFPLAEVVTVELPSTDPILANTYEYVRGGLNKLTAFEERLRKNIHAPNIKLVRANSFFLPAVVEGDFDLVWIDGGHLYPEIAWDICNAYHRVRSGGFLMCDDIIIHPKGKRDAYVSPDAHDVLQYLVARTSDRLELYLKRTSAEWSADPRARKYVALLTKTSG